ncbi:FERM, ARHGEF and pleckstrin domain-containing protein 1-like isoform X2 [Anthonomus grandis grandis]|uniref:FERM, ARHGEF and pleckstrin domain-containing protein 1-like isoform X2 n=1 Tax=Anthonomus grandis grandis TaxID=2921223 RepID=UPI0021658FE7|nr:FERM, ARHGEF and pleckstrin domain-containing protein 1-like isoform X2 [Anthonomus grandis grandis]
MEVASARGSTGALSSSADSVTGHMHHSMSTPAGVDGGGSRTPPTTPKKGGKMLAMRVQMLDDTITIFQVQAKALGRVLFDQVCKQLHLLEADYFGLEYADCHGTRYWLDLQKPISRQLGLSLVDPILYFCVKFYTPDPAQLEEEYTRYLFCLQVKRDLAQGYMQCNENTASLMASYIVQAECGDFVPEDYPDHTYLSSYKFVPHQDHEMEKKIMENHKKHMGQSPAEADLNLLETARRCELYGMKMHPAKDHENVCLNLAVAHMGILVFQNYTKINTFSWAKIRKISFKRKKFLIKLHPEGYGFYKDTVEFFFEGRNECKNFWKKCVENHGFFRCSAVKNVSRHKTRVLSRGSSFRYSGKTQKQVVEFVRDNYVKRQTFQSGSVQTLSVPGIDEGGGRDRAPGFSDDEISLSPPRHSYVLELGPRHHRQQHHQHRYETTAGHGRQCGNSYYGGTAAAGCCSDDELAFSDGDAVGYGRGVAEPPRFAPGGPQHDHVRSHSQSEACVSSRRTRGCPQSRHRYPKRRVAEW